MLGWLAGMLGLAGALDPADRLAVGVLAPTGPVLGPVYAGFHRLTAN